LATKYLDSKRIRGLGKEIVGLKAYFTLNESTGDFINTASAIGSTDAISNFDLTASASWAARGQVGGLIDQCPAWGSTSKATADGSNLTDTNFISQAGAEWTICLWLKQNTIAADGGLFSTTNHETGEAGVYVRTSTNGAIQLLCGSQGSPNDRINVVSSAVLPNTAWNFLMVQYSDTTGIAKIQINTTLQSFTTNTDNSDIDLTNTKTPSDKFQLGNNQPMDNFFNGDMDEVSVWNRILTTAQITDIYNAGLTGTSSAGESLTTISSLKETTDRETLVTAATAADADWTVHANASISGGKISVTGSGESHKAFSMGDPTSFVWDFDFYRGDNDTSVSGGNNNVVLLSSNTGGYQDPSVSNDKLVLVYQASNIVVMSFRNKPAGSSFEENNTTLGAVQGTDTTKYYRMILHSSNNTGTFTRYPTDADRTADTNEELTVTSGTISSNWFSGNDLQYLVVDGHSSGTKDFGVSSVKLWLGTETASGTKTIDETFSAIPATSNLQENTIFDETDTRSQYWLQTLDSQKDWFPTWYDTFATNKGWTAGASSTTMNVIHKDAFYIEIPELDTKWVADLDIYWDNIGSNQEYITFTSYAPFNYPASTGSPQFISIRMEEGNGTLRETIRCTQFVGSETNTNDGSKISGTVSDTWYYYRLVRDGDGVTLTRYSSDANRQSNTSGASCAYPDFVGDIGWVESTKIKYINTTGHSTNCNFDVKNIRIYNGVTSI